MSVYAGPEIVTDGLVLHLDSGNAKSYPGSGTTWNDLSGNGNNGTLVNAPTYNGQSFAFTQASAQRISIPYKSEWRLIGSNSISYWSNEASEIGVIVGYQKGSWRGYNLSAGSMAYSGTDGSNDLSNTISKTYGIWNNLSLVIDRTAGYYYTYKNGLLVDSKVIVHPDLSAFANGELTIGGNGTISGRYYTGSIGLATFYTKALTAAEVQQNFNAIRGRFNV